MNEAGASSTPIQGRRSPEKALTKSLFAGLTLAVIAAACVGSTTGASADRAISDVVPAGFESGWGSETVTLPSLTAAVTQVSSGGGQIARTPGGDGYWMIRPNGEVQAFGSATSFGNTLEVSQEAVAIAPTISGNGYWLVASDGDVIAFGDAQFYGSMRGQRLNAEVVSITPTPSGSGYWLVASDGGVFAFGDAGFHGSVGGLPLDQPVVGMATTATGNGYWMVASDGGVFAFGDAEFYGSTGGQSLNKPVVAMAATPSGNGYWLVASDGGVFAFGDAGFHGSGVYVDLHFDIDGITPTPSGDGYWLSALDGGVFTFGDAAFYGSTIDSPENSQRNLIVEIAQGEVGKVEVPLRSNVVPGTEYATDGRPWSAYFVRWVWEQAGSSIPVVESVRGLKDWSMANTTLRPVNAVPQVGDAVVSNNGAAGSHATIVVAVSGNRFKTIGGDESDGVRESDWMTWADRTGNARDWGFASPSTPDIDHTKNETS